MDENQLAAKILGEIMAPKKRKRKNPAAVALGRLGGLKGGKARASKLSASQRKDIARKAAETRWKTKSGQ